MDIEVKVNPKSWRLEKIIINGVDWGGNGEA